jgi:hypothetical protein
MDVSISVNGLIFLAGQLSDAPEGLPERVAGTVIRHFLWAEQWEEERGHPLKSMHFRTAFIRRNVSGEKELLDRIIYNPFYRYEGFLLNDLLGIKFPYDGNVVGILTQSK